jgi:hypothetical protein
MSTGYRHGLIRARQLRDLIDEIVDADWRHPSWWPLCTGVALLEARRPDPLPADPIAAVRDHYIASSGGPRTDTFMARTRPAPPDPAARVADAILAARAALDVLRDLQGQFPGQPLDTYLTGGPDDLRPAALGREQARVAFATARGAVVASLAPDPAGDARLAASLAAFARHGRASAQLVPVRAGSTRATRAALTVAIGDECLATARHLHRRAWSAAGGPWLGVGTTADMQVVTTCHMIVDGYGHARIAAEIVRRQDQLARRWGRELAAAVQAPGFACDLPRLDDTVPLGVAIAQVRAQPDFAAFAHALGRGLEEHVRGHLAPAARRTFGFSPTFQVPVAPGALHDPARRRRRVVHALLSVRMNQGLFEPLERFRDRLPAILERERAGMGLLTRIHQAVSRAPVPIAVKRRMYSRAVIPRPWLPAIEALAGRSSLSLLRFAAGEEPGLPLHAVSASAPDPSPADPRGSSVLTIVPSPTGLALTVCGTGATGTEAGARAFLQRWLERYQETASAPGRTPALRL